MADLGEAFSRDLRGFQALLPRDIVLASIYVIGGLVIVFCVATFGMSYLAYPRAAGSALIAPRAIESWVGRPLSQFHIRYVDVSSALPDGTFPWSERFVRYASAIHDSNFDYDRGAALSLILFSLTAVSFPLLLDRDDVDFVTAI